MMNEIYKEAYIKVCEEYKKGKPMDSLIKKYLYGLFPEDEYPSLSFGQWLTWACKESRDDDSNPVLILCMAEYIKQEQSLVRHGRPLNKHASAAFAVFDTINCFLLDDDIHPQNIIGGAVRYLFNEESINDIISSTCSPMFMESISQLPDCGVEFFPRKDLIEACANEEKLYLLHVCGIKLDTPIPF